MTRTPLSIPEIGLIAATRAALGGGIALLLGDLLNRDQRRAVGWTLFALGAITTLPIAVQIWKSRQPEHEHGEIGGRFGKKEYAQ